MYINLLGLLGLLDQEITNRPRLIWDYRPPIAWASPIKNGIHTPIATGVPMAVEAPM
jgi:hypothetical protein